MRRVGCLLLILILASLPILAQEPEEQTPPFRPIKATFQLAAGVGSGLVLGYAGTYAGAWLTRDEGWGALGGAIAGMVLGYGLGSSLGVYLAGNIGNETASFWATMAGGVGGGVVAMAAAGWMARNIHENAGFVTLVAIPPISALVAYQLTCRYKEVPEE